MIGEILKYINKWFVDTLESSTEYTIVTDGVEGTFNESYVVGQYISIDGSKVNDGVYKLTAVSTVKLTVADTLIAEDTDNYIDIWGLAIPSEIINLDVKITAYDALASQGVVSESQGSRSVSYDGNSSWQNAFKSTLSRYKSIHSDKGSYRPYNADLKR